MKNDDREVCSKTAPKSTKNTKVCYKNLDDSDDEQERVAKNPEKHQSAQNLFIETRMTQMMDKNCYYLQ